ncbi:hypothetical protein PHLCEN_2v5411 [Hermanssonia centrifuga]|uniref:Uncharacterized protein n=1 Tax=Hermanssonia centrifuga TaxID=98765 RepID=A0A2R6P5B5_9APHY|nr:hypothetical protein PHLCEN_2v5411 [Hermanssonia centrifuga]
MRFFLPLVTLAAAVFGYASANPLLARQEAERFGGVEVVPNTVKLGEEFVVTYNSTTAEAQPQFLDVYIQGTLPSGFEQPYFLLLRTDYPADSHSLAFQTTLPTFDDDVNNGYVVDASYLIWAFITFPSPDTTSGSLEVGGISTTIGVDLS